ncbi:MAG: DUF2723 domain-containing protein [Candidatus Coatesbacteria bacterium]|nr:MAG: DUF2723 domain-containing protein [Candidatus Coatesbacteria bacterium]
MKTFATTRRFTGASAGALLSVLLPAGLYLLTLAPTITFEDSGQLITAAATLGISHPSGYPAFALVGQLFTLLPFGGWAWKVNLASAAAAAAACGVFYLLLRRLFRAAAAEAEVAASVAAAAAAVALGFSFTFWSQAVVAETYALNALVLIATLACVLNFAATGEARWGYAAAFLGGLALAAHTSSVVVTVPAAVYLIIRFRRLPGVRGLFLAGTLAAFGFSVYLYLPLRAAQGPAINWGDPRKLPALYAHFTRRMYGGAEVARLPFLPGHLLELGKFLAREFTPVGAAGGVAGIILALARRERPWGFLVALLIITGPLSAVLLVLLLQSQQAAGINVWYIPCFIWAAAFVGWALFELARHRRRLVRLSGYVAAAAVVAFPLGLHFQHNNYRNYFFAEDFGGNFLRTINYNGLNLSFLRGSLGTYEVAYLKKVEGRRPDHTFVEATGFVFRDYEGFAVGRRAAPDAEAAAYWDHNFEWDLLSSPTGRGVYYGTFREEVASHGFVLVPEGMLYRAAQQPPDTHEVSPVWDRYSFRGVADVAFRPEAPPYAADEWVRDATCRYKLMLASEYFLAGDETSALATVSETAPIAAGLSSPLAEIGAVYFKNGYYAEAAEFYRRSAEAFPRAGGGEAASRLLYARVRQSEGWAHLYAGEVEAAEAAFRASLAADPDQPDLAPLAERAKLERLAREIAAPNESR